MKATWLIYAGLLGWMTGCGFPGSSDRNEREDGLRGWLGGSAPPAPVATLRAQPTEPAPGVVSPAVQPEHAGASVSASTGKTTSRRKPLVLLSGANDPASIAWGADATFLYFSDDTSPGIMRADLRTASLADASKPWQPGYGFVELQGGEVLGRKKDGFFWLNPSTRQPRPADRKPLNCTQLARTSSHTLCWRSALRGPGRLTLVDEASQIEKPVARSFSTVSDLTALAASFFVAGDDGIFEVDATGAVKKRTTLAPGRWQLAPLANQVVFAPVDRRGPTTLGLLAGATVTPAWRSVPYPVDALASDGRTLYMVNDKAMAALHPNGDQVLTRDDSDDELTPYRASLRVTPTHAFWIRAFQGHGTVYQLVGFARE